ncbi:hypothetical protein DUNSADRAFT_7279 [Dunaliella salina]|uniref:P-type ATPase A domain-containing protein n=1 Tax=Dunaliella salina TaxID=3046 RepID=A0ABQ7GLK1_DUNSA|nr:hypothetical protein DUNSADRAFT_7279 [Dunaliella salina]|eukprot:KAF5835495.1 hypothetical protein DUNSADRAFT_7279 [Dunaliella salina]
MRGDYCAEELDAELVQCLQEVKVLRFYKRPWWKLTLFVIVSAFSSGILWLASLWAPALFSSLTMSDSNPEDADYVYVELLDKRCGVCRVHKCYSDGYKKEVRWFLFHTVRFMYSKRKDTFCPVAPAPRTLATELAHASRDVREGSPRSLSQPNRLRRQQLYGKNLLEVEAPSYWRIFGHDAAQPFYCFQYASVVIWMYEDYYSYSSVVLVITLASIIINVISQYKERKRMSEMAYYVCNVERVSMDSAEQALGPKGPFGLQVVSSLSLVPGDIVVVVPGKAPCDMVLLDGEVVVDETILTGESVPVRKVPYDPDLEGPYSAASSSHCTIFNGTSVVAARGGRGGKPALAMVSATGFSTAKGQLLRAILFPIQHDLHFVKQAMYFICVMLVVACGFYLWNVVAMVGYHASTRDIAVKALDLVTVAVPPALACCLAIATTISVARLKKRGVHVQDNERVRVAGLLDTICFDKTGTLTDIGLELGGVVPATKGSFERPILDSSQLSPSTLELFSTCHGLTQLQHQVVGDPLDQRLFEASGFEIGFEDHLPSIAYAPPSTAPQPSQQPQNPARDSTNTANCASLNAPCESQIAHQYDGSSPEASSPTQLWQHNNKGTDAAVQLPCSSDGCTHSTSTGGASTKTCILGTPAGTQGLAGPFLVVRRCPTASSALSHAAPPSPLSPQALPAFHHRKHTAPMLDSSTSPPLNAVMPQHEQCQQKSSHQQLQVPVSVCATDTATCNEDGGDQQPLLSHCPTRSHALPLDPPVGFRQAAGGVWHNPVLCSPSTGQPVHHSLPHPLDQTGSLEPSGMDGLAARAWANPSTITPELPTMAPLPPSTKTNAEHQASCNDSNDDDDDEVLFSHNPGDGGLGHVDGYHSGIHLATEPFPPSESLHVLRRFDFSSERLRCTSVAMHPDGRLAVHVKGSPERLLAFMDPATVPGNFMPLLKEYTNQGLRVIGMASRQLPASCAPGTALRMSQDELEAGAAFMGLVLMVNRLKPESAPTIAHLHAASIRTAMVTGDHVRTAINVARQCAIMDHFRPALIVDTKKGVEHDSSTAFTFEVVHPVAPTAPTQDRYHKQQLQGTGLNGLPPQPQQLQQAQSASMRCDEEEGIGEDDARRALLAGGAQKSHMTGSRDANHHDHSNEDGHHHHHQQQQQEQRLPDQELALLSHDRASAQTDMGTLLKKSSSPHQDQIPRPNAAGTHTIQRIKPATTTSACDKHGGPPVPDGFLEQCMALRQAALGEMQIAVTGPAWQRLIAEPEDHPDLLQIVLQRGRVFARMSPESKRCLLGMLGFGDVDAHGHAHPGCGYYTGFCGDGANDMGALKGALVGVSLCDAEASIAAPMTSRISHIGVMATVVAEGRCSMVTSLIIFKYTMVYAFIQVLALALLYNRGLTVGNFQVAVDAMFQLLALYLLEHELWFAPFNASANKALDISVSEKRPEAGVLFIIACWQLVINALVFNVGKPFRRGLWTNSWLLGVLTVLITFDLYVLWAPGDPFRRKVPAVIDLPLVFRAKLFGLILANLVAAYTADWIVTRAHQVLGHVVNKCLSKCRGYALAKSEPS